MEVVNTGLQCFWRGGRGGGWQLGCISHVICKRISTDMNHTTSQGAWALVSEIQDGGREKCLGLMKQDVHCSGQENVLRRF